MVSNDELVYVEIQSATRHLKRAYELSECHFCKEDVLLVLNAAKDLEQIADFARDLVNHPHRLKAIRVLASNLDKMHLLSVLVVLYKNSLISKILLMGSHARREEGPAR